MGKIRKFCHFPLENSIWKIFVWGAIFQETIFLGGNYERDNCPGGNCRRTFTIQVLGHFSLDSFPPDGETNFIIVDRTNLLNTALGEIHKTKFLN